MAATLDDVLRELQTHTNYLRGGGNSSAQPSMSSRSAPSFSSAGSQALDGITGVFGKFKQSADNVLNDWRLSQSNFGIGMNNDAIGLRNSAIMNRMTMQEWGEAINTGRIGFTSLGGTMNDSAKVFSQMSMRFSDTTASDNLAKIGYTTGDYNKLLAITITNNRQLNLQKEQDQQKVIDATEKLGKEMDKVSQLSGISRKEQMDKMEKDRVDMSYQATLELMRREGKGEGATGLTNIGQEAMMTGTDDLVKNLAEGNQLTKESSLQLTNMGELAPKFEAAVKEMTNASTAAEREAAEARFKEVNAQVASRLKSDEMLRLAKAGPAAGPAAESLMAQQLRANGANFSDAIQKTMKERNVSEEEARKILEEKVALSQEGKEKKESGKVVDIAGAKTTEAMVLAGRRFDDAGVKVAQFAQAVNEAGGKILKNSGVLRDFQNVDEKGVPFSKRVYGQAGEDTIGSVKSGTFTKDLLTNATALFQQAFKGGTTIAADLIKLSGTIVNDGTNPFTAGPEQELTIPPGGSHANGTKESFGDWFGKDFGGGMLARLHGKEAVIPEEKINEFITDMQQQLTGGMNELSTQSDQNYYNELSKIKSSDFEQPFESNTVKQTTQQQQNDEIKPSITGDVTLKDINEQLTKLNTVMIKLVTNTNEMVDNSSKQYRATKQLSPNLNAR